jgi:hypothetical protein
LLKKSGVIAGHTQKFGGDLKRICGVLRRVQEEPGCLVVRCPPRIIEPRPGISMAKPFENLSHFFDTRLPDLSAQDDEHQP